MAGSGLGVYLQIWFFLQGKEQDEKKKKLGEGADENKQQQTLKINEAS